MTRSDESNRAPLRDSSSRELWRRCQATDAVADEAARFLDLAGFAEASLDDDEHERVAALIAMDAAAAADVAAAQALANGAFAADGRIVERAAALVYDGKSEHGRAVAFRWAHWRRPSIQGFARWGGLAAAVAMACWLGFAMGMDASLALGPPSEQATGEDLLPDFNDSSTGFLINLDGLQT